MDFKPIRRVWRDVQYDSQLEADWAATLMAWGIEYVYHPGRLFLQNGDIWEPDFQLDGDIILEVKGAHDDRIDKAYRAHAETGIPVIIARTGWMPAGSDTEFAGAVWEPEHWTVANVGSRLKFVDTGEGAMSAIMAYARGTEGIRMFKAVGESDIV